MHKYRRQRYIRSLLNREYQKWKDRERREAEKRAIADAFLDKVLADGSVRYIMAKTVKEHKTHKGKYVYGRIQIKTDADLIGKQVAIVIVTPSLSKKKVE